MTRSCSATYGPAAAARGPDKHRRGGSKLPAMKSHEGGVRAVTVAFGALLVLIGVAVIGYRSLRRSRVTVPTLEDLLAYGPAVIGLGTLGLAFLVTIYVARHAMDDERAYRSPRRRDRFG